MGMVSLNLVKSVTVEHDVVRTDVVMGLHAL